MAVAVHTSTDLDIAPIAGYLGADVSGVSLADEISPEIAERLRAALVEYKVLFFRDQPLDHVQHIRFSRTFGKVTPAHPYEESLEGFPEIFEVDSRKFAAKAGTKNFAYASVWHQDITSLINPPAVTTLRAELVPEIGGDTTWTDLTAAYANLPASLQKFLDGSYAEHRTGGRAPKWDDDSETARNAKRIPILSEHPVVRVHPVTGARALFVTPGFTSRIVGLSARQSDRILDLLFDEIANPAYTVRIGWTPDSLGVWDNRATAHLAPADLDHLDVVRVLYRTTIEGDVPLGADGGSSRSISGDPFFA